MGKPFAIVGALLSVLTYLFFESRVQEQAQRARMQQALQAIQLHDAELNRDVLMARAGLLANYDSLAATSRKISENLEALKAGNTGHDAKGSAAVTQGIERLATALNRKLTIIEYLKSDNALLRNSLAYFARSLGLLRERGNTGRPALEIAALSHVMLRFVQAPGTATKVEAESALATLSEVSSGSATLEPLTAHGRLIVAVLPRVDALLDNIVASATASNVEALQRVMLDHGAAAEARALRFRFLLYVGALVLLGYLVYQYARLRTKAKELRQKEIQLIQANKMSALGMLVSGVAHEINNPNQVVLLNAGVMGRLWDDAVEILDRYEQDHGRFALAGLPYQDARDKVAQLSHEVEEGARRIQAILSDLKYFVRPGMQTNEAFQLNDVVDRALRLLTHVIHKRTDNFNARLAEGLPCLQGNPQQVEQIVVNLVVNALESLPQRDKQVMVTTDLDATRGLVSLEVCDEGVGIRRDHLSRLGEPFFTTKEASGGTGLGIAITSSLVRSHNARISFSSEVGKGTRARVLFPSAAEAV